MLTDSIVVFSIIVSSHFGHVYAHRFRERERETSVPAPSG